MAIAVRGPRFHAGGCDRDVLHEEAFFIQHAAMDPILGRHGGAQGQAEQQEEAKGAHGHVNGRTPQMLHGVSVCGSPRCAGH